MTSKTILLSLFVFCMSLIIGNISCQKSTEHPCPVNLDSTEETVALLDFLYQISGEYVLTGHHNWSFTPTRYNEAVKKMTGHYPVVWGNDFSFTFRGRDPEMVRQKMIDTAIELHEKGHIITLMWHCCYPVDGDTCDSESIWVWEDKVKQAEWDSLTTAGTELNDAWRAQMDIAAGYLNQLQDAKVPVLWRPYHEMNGVWFWWCKQPGQQGFVKLWKMMYDYLTDHHQLNNLIWVWNANAPRDIPGDEAYAYEDYFPGTRYVDVLAADVYRNDYKQSHHDDLLALAEGKLIALGEVGQMPSAEILEAQPQWTWFMGWSNFLHTANDSTDVVALYKAPRTLTLDDIKKNDDGSYTVMSK